MAVLKDVKRIVVKVGTSTLTYSTGKTNIRRIGSRAFAYCEFLETVTLPDTLETVGAEAFRECGNLQALIVGKGTASIEKDAFAKRIIKLYEDSTGIKITENIEELEIATPLTFARYLNTPQGVIYGYSTDNKDNMLSRFMTEESDSDTKGLRFCGGFGTQGAGVHSAIASGRNTCYATLYDIEKEDINNIYHFFL